MSEVKTWLDFAEFETPKRRKTKRVGVWNKETQEYLGVITWRSGWRQYVFSPGTDVEFSKGCMLEIYNKIDQLMKEWKNGV